jgi:hypothetical protein
MQYMRPDDAESQRRTSDYRVKKQAHQRAVMRRVKGIILVVVLIGIVAGVYFTVGKKWLSSEYSAQKKATMENTTVVRGAVTGESRRKLTVKDDDVDSP